MFIMGHHGGMSDIVEIIEPHAANNEDRATVSEDGTTPLRHI